MFFFFEFFVASLPASDFVLPLYDNTTHVWSTKIRVYRFQGVLCLYKKKRAVSLIPQMSAYRTDVCTWVNYVFSGKWQLHSDTISEQFASL